MNLLTAQEVSKKIGQSYFHFQRVTKYQKDFPKPFKPTENAHPKWREDDIEAYIQKRIAA